MFPASCRTLFGRHAVDRDLDLIEPPDPAQRLLGDRRLGLFVLVVEMPPSVRPTGRVGDAGREKPSGLVRAS